MSAGFSPKSRSASLARLRSEAFDVLVIGGGIVGAAVARDAATRGLHTALVEKGDFASGTTGKTSRLVHGGLRYLRDVRVGLVREAVRERDLLLLQAPALVRALRFAIPVYQGGGPGKTSLRFGLFLYDILSKRKGLPRRRWLGPREFLREEPRLKPDRLLGGAMYYDAWVDDARLVLAVLRDATEAGAAVANHVEAVRLLRDGDRVVGAHLRDRIAGDAFDVRARAVVNATGVWLDALRASPPGRATLRPTKGIHILLPRSRIGNREAVVLRAKRDGRMIFVLPWGSLALVGTTDTEYAGDPDHVLPEAEDVAYLIESVNDAFPEARVGPADIVSSYAGLRPLVRGRDPRRKESDISRAHELFEDPDGLVSVAGGKLTTQRAMAEDVVDRVVARLGRSAACVTAERTLGPPPDAREGFGSLGFDEAAAAHLACRHRPEDLRPWMGEPGARQKIHADLPYLWCEALAAVGGEMAMHLADVMVRRLGLFYEARDQGRAIATAIAARIAPLLAWDAARIREEVLAYERLIEDHRRFREDHAL